MRWLGLQARTKYNTTGPVSISLNEKRKCDTSWCEPVFSA